jgi:hypothetical protein
MSEESLHAFGIDGVRAPLMPAEPTTEVGYHANFAADRVLCVVLPLKPDNQLVNVRTQWACIHPATSTFERKEYSRAHAYLSDRD